MNRDELAQAIIDLENGQFGPLEDEQLAQELGQHLKPLIDQGVSFHTPSPSHRSQETDEPLDRELGPAKPPVRTPVRFDGPTPDPPRAARNDYRVRVLSGRIGQTQ